MFPHPLVRSAIYDAQRPTRRAATHLAVADALPSDRVAEIAHHLAAAGRLADPQRTGEWARRAGEQAMAQLAFEAAARHFEAGAAVASGEEAPGLLLAAGEAHRRAGTIDAARASFIAGAQAARRAAQPDVLALCALGLGGGASGLTGVVGDDERVALL